ncbi:MAG: acyltransferase family protein [Bacteriovoracaceae bacterium]|nr:acyltransferase family protein [Bacteriovoracaceae bacterium]
MQLSQAFKSIWGLSPEDDAKISEVFEVLRVKYQTYQDPWGFNLELCEKVLRQLIPVYRRYFKVRVFGQENVKDDTYIVVSNHTGQIPLDGMLITIAFLLEVQPPRVLRAMIERFMAQLPFIGDFTAQTGSILGDRVNCQYLLDHGESILVFPEGVRGVSKSTPKFYKTQHFSHGFYRIALQKHTPILPLAVVGAEEMFPFVWHVKSLAKLLKVPALPLTANFFPLPSPIDIYIGKPIETNNELTPESPEKDINEQVLRVEGQVKKLLAVGLKHRRPFFDEIRKPLSKFVMKQDLE